MCVCAGADEKEEDEEEGLEVEEGELDGFAVSAYFRVFFSCSGENTE